MMLLVDPWAPRAALARRRLARLLAEQGRPNPEFCAALIVARGERGLTVEEMAAELGCSPSLLEALERGLVPPEQAPAAVRLLIAAAAEEDRVHGKRTRPEAQNDAGLA